MKIAAFDRESVNVLCRSIETALAAVAEAHGIKLAVGKAAYSQDTCTVRIEAAVVGANGEPINHEAEDFRTHAAFFGLKPEHLGQTFTDSHGLRFKLVGLNVKARNNPFVIADVTGKRFVAPESMILQGFGVARPVR